MKRYEKVNLMVTIAHRGEHAAIIKGLRELGVTYNMATVGESTGGLSLKNYLGFETNEIDCVFSVVSDSKKEQALAFIEYCDYIGARKKGRAIAALMPIEGVSGPLALEYISGPLTSEQRKESGNG